MDFPGNINVLWKELVFDTNNYINIKNYEEIKKIISKNPIIPFDQ